MVLKRTRSPSPLPPRSNTSSQQIFHSPPITDRSSIFIAHYSPTHSAKSLQAPPDFQSATHRIAAWRRPSDQHTLLASGSRLYTAGHDDDGERYAGKKLESLLEAMDVEGAVVVARWYGGVMLGPARFRHVETCARQAVTKWKEGQQQRRGRQQQQQQQREKGYQSDGEDSVVKKPKLQVEEDEDEEKVRKRLARTLEERDQSIGVLRELLAEKSRPMIRLTQAEKLGSTTTTTAATATATTATTTVDVPQNTSPVSPPTKKMDYTAMPLEQLKRLDKARDATIAWILKGIDKAEAEAEAEQRRRREILEVVDVSPSARDLETREPP